MFLVFLIILVANGGDLQNTSKATIAMHEETVQMKKDAKAMWKKFRANFPSNQEEVTTEQVLDMIDKGHAMMVWVDGVRHRTPQKTVSNVITGVNDALSFINGHDETRGGVVASVVKQVSSIMKLVTAKDSPFMGLIGQVNKTLSFINGETPPSEGIIGDVLKQVNRTLTYLNDALELPDLVSVRSRSDHHIRTEASIAEGMRHAMFKNVAGIIQRGYEWVSTINAEEFHEGVVDGKALMRNGVRLMKAVGSDKLGRIVDHVDHVLGSADADKVVDHISSLVSKTHEALDRFLGAGGLRVSLPLGPMLPSPDAPAAEPAAANHTK